MVDKPTGGASARYGSRQYGSPRFESPRYGVGYDDISRNRPGSGGFVNGDGFGNDGWSGNDGWGGARPRPDRRPSRAWNWLVAIPVIAPLLTPLYNRVNPQLWGIPFFYWYQLACALLAVVVITAVYRLTSRRS